MTPRFFGRSREHLFRDRIDAGEHLAARLSGWCGFDVLVLGLPRGGVPVAAEVARALDAELDVIIARKIGAPQQPELAIGAVTANGGLYLDTSIVDNLHVSRELLERMIAREREVALKREVRFRGEHAFPHVEGCTVILVDDGLATGATMQAAVHSVRKQNPRRLIVAAPVGSTHACEQLASEADEVVCLHARKAFRAVGLYYEDFTPTEDVEVEQILGQFRRPLSP